ncbi:hypothetical protein CHISP_3745 [Chitinispirillum alkaliphilum]|nr:hypothetical protein CHISP_3745 [Chitinispirillum alkaliphilum]
MKLLKFCILLIAATALLSCIDPSGVKMKIEQKDATSQNLLFVTTYDHLYGFDQNSFEQKVKINFDRRNIGYGAKTPDGRIILADRGRTGGGWGSRLLVLDQNFNIIKEIETNPMPMDPVLFGNYIFVGCASFVNDGPKRNSIEIFDASTYEKVKEIPVEFDIERPEYSEDNENVYIAVTNLRKDKFPYIISVNKTNLEVNQISYFEPSYNIQRYILKTIDSVLLASSYSVPSGVCINILDITNNQAIASVKLDTLTSLATSNMTFLLTPTLIDGKLHFPMKSYKPPYTRIVTLSFPELELLEIKTPDHSYDPWSTDYYYLDDTLLVTYGQSSGPNYGLNLISMPSGDIVKHAPLD